MKWLCACLAVLFMVAPAMAGEDPYIGVVDSDISASARAIANERSRPLRLARRASPWNRGTILQRGCRSGLGAVSECWPKHRVPGH